MNIDIGLVALGIFIVGAAFLQQHLRLKRLEEAWRSHDSRIEANFRWHADRGHDINRRHDMLVDSLNLVVQQSNQKYVKKESK